MSDEVYFYNNLLPDASTVTATNELSGFPDAKLEDWKYPSIIWKSNNDISDVSIVIDMGAAVQVDGFALLNTNFGSATTAKIQAHTADSWATPSENENLVMITRTNGLNGDTRYDAYYQVSTTFGTGWTYRYYRFNFTLASGTLISAGSIFMADDVYTVVKEDSDGVAQNRLMITKDKRIHQNVNEDSTQSGHRSRQVNSSSRNKVLTYTGGTETHTYRLDDMEQSDYICFLPEGSGDDIYFGDIAWGPHVPIHTAADRKYNTDGIFQENRK